MTTAPRNGKLARRLRRTLRRGPGPRRVAVQSLFTLLVCWIGWDFYRFVRHFESAGASAYVGRPGGVEAFLPISALMSLRYWVETRIIHPVHPAGLVLFLTILGLSLVLKKGFCGWVCPVGFLSETLSRLGAWAFGRNLRLPRWLDPPLRSLKYLLLAFFLWAVLTMPLTGLRAFLDSPYNRVADVKMLRFFTDISSTALGALIILVALSVPIRHLWCRYLCPYGGLLGLLSLASPFKVQRDPERCTDCGQCSRVCPASLPVHRLGRIRSDECNACVECVRSCPAPGALELRLPALVPEPRRSLSPARLAAVVLLLFFVPLGVARLSGVWESSVTDEEMGRRILEIDSPVYTHARGSAPPDPGRPRRASREADAGIAGP